MLIHLAQELKLLVPVEQRGLARAEVIRQFSSLKNEEYK